MFGLGITELIVGPVSIYVFAFLPGVFFLATLQKTLNRCSENNRTLPPRLVWLTMIPIFGAVWAFVVVQNVARSLKREFEDRDRSINLMPGQRIGLAMCILWLFSLVPFLWLAAVVPALICWIIYWVQISNFSFELSH